ncbi:unnamed protein product [Schistosoma mattheei]|uniref:Uncharacterized protein n=1 Tax=Schistosoma mattheei TaxID=31246 RepID=A0A183NZ15_9TREM|nr:unnamed protein product [Schistosoma mattheei]
MGRSFFSFCNLSLEIAFGYTPSWPFAQFRLLLLRSVIRFAFGVLDNCFFELAADLFVLEGNPFGGLSIISGPSGRTNNLC